MSVPGGIRVKLAIALLAVVGGALAAAYVIVVPSLERRLVDAKLEQLEANAGKLAVDFSQRVFATALEPDDYVGNAASIYDARVVIFATFGPPVELLAIADSAAIGERVMEADPVARDSARTGSISRARVHRGGRLYGEVAVPLLQPAGGVLLLSASLADQLATVRLVQRRLLYATVAALAIALILGLGTAAMHARRILRLQRAADRIAAGRFDEPIVDTSGDELGQLARSFDRMRLEVAQLDTARKEFVANASHELRTPLFSLAGFLELMADEDLDEGTRAGFLVTTREQVARLTKLATDLLDLSRIDAGRLRVEKEEVGLGEAARAIADEMRALAERTGHRLVVDAPDDVWAIADEERVLQIGRALAGNALTHAPAGTTVRVRASQRGDRALLTVEDDGPGIPAAHLERIFDRFYRVESRHASGSGLGLAIARELAARMGGGVTVESRPGRTVFTVDLPGSPAAARLPELVAGL